MAEWLYEDGIGERRAALVDGDSILAIGIERDSDGARAGDVLPARLLPGDGSGLRIIRLESGEEAICTHLPRTLPDGASLLVAVTRSAIPEVDLVKRAKARPAEPSAMACTGPDLAARIAADGYPVRHLLPHQPDALEAAGWSEALAAAASGRIPFPGGLLRLVPTPAMTVIDIDGTLPPRDLAMAGARAVASALARYDMGGSIVVDFPTLPDKGARQAVVEAFDAQMAPPFERTAINGFGLLQIVRPRLRASIVERLQFAPLESAALAALRRVERAGGTGDARLVAHPAVVAWMDARPDLVAMAERRAGRRLSLHAEPGRAMAAVDVQ